MSLRPGQRVRVPRYLGSDELHEAIYLGHGKPLVGGPYPGVGQTAPVPMERVRFPDGEELLVPPESMQPIN
jgi:hypothetical protein